MYTTGDSTDYKQEVFEFVYISDNRFKLNSLNDISVLNTNDKIISIFVDSSNTAPESAPEPESEPGPWGGW